MFTNSGVWLIGALGILIGLAAGYYLRQRFALRLKDSTERKAQKELEEAREKVKTIVLEAQDKAASILVDIQKEEKERKQELRRLEERLLKKEDLLESERRD